MTTFEERERGYEAKFAHDQDVRFRVTARRDKLFALWAAGELGMDEGGREELTHSVMGVVDGAGHDDRLRTLVAARFMDLGRPVGDGAIGEALGRCAMVAEEQLRGEKLGG